MSRWVSSWLCRPWTSSSSTSTLLPTYAPVSSVSTTSSSLSTSIPSAHTWRDTFDDWRRILQLVIPYDFDDDLIIIARYYTCTEVPRPRPCGSGLCRTLRPSHSHARGSRSRTRGVILFMEMTMVVVVVVKWSWSCSVRRQRLGRGVLTRATVRAGARGRA